MKKKISLLEKIFPILLSGLAIFITTKFVETTSGSLIIFASLGASTVILSNFPNTRMAKVRVVLISYLIAALVGYFCSVFVPNIPIAAGLAVALIMLFMILTNNVHPPSGGVTLSFIFQSKDVIELFYLVLGCVILLILIKLGIYTLKCFIISKSLKKELDLKDFYNEFLR